MSSQQKNPYDQFDAANPYDQFHAQNSAPALDVAQLGQQYWQAVKSGDKETAQAIYNKLRDAGHSLPGPQGADMSRPQKATFGQDLAHSALLTNQNTLHGIGDVIGLGWNPLAHGVNWAEGKLGINRAKYGLGTANQNIDWALRAAGYPQVTPNNAIERIGG